MFSDPNRGSIWTVADKDIPPGKRHSKYHWVMLDMSKVIWEIASSDVNYNQGR